MKKSKMFMKIKDEISGLMDDWHASTHCCRGALGRGWGTMVSCTELQCHPLSSLLLFKYRYVTRDSAPQAALLPPELSPAFCHASHELACGWGQGLLVKCLLAGLWWGCLHPCTGLCLAASRNQAPPAPGGEGELCWLGSISLGPACGGTCCQLLALGMLLWSLETSHPTWGGHGSE